MQKSIILIFAVFIIFNCFSPNAGAQQVTTLNIVENDWPPYFFAGKKDLPQGIAKELLKLCIPGTYNYSFKFFPVKRMYAYLENGQLDMALFSYKKQRTSFLVYGKEPLFSSSYRPVVLQGKNIRINSIKDFDSLRLGHLAGLKYSKDFFEYIEKRKQAKNLIIATTGNSCIRMLLEGIIDVFVDTRETILWRAKQIDILDKIKILDYDIQTRDYFVTISKASNLVKDKRDFLNKIDLCIKSSKENGQYKMITEKYGWK